MTMGVFKKSKFKGLNLALTAIKSNASTRLPTIDLIALNDRYQAPQSEDVKKSIYRLAKGRTIPTLKLRLAKQSLYQPENLRKYPDLSRFIQI